MDALRREHELERHTWSLDQMRTEELRTIDELRRAVNHFEYELGAIREFVGVARAAGAPWQGQGLSILPILTDITQDTRIAAIASREGLEPLYQSLATLYARVNQLRRSSIPKNAPDTTSLAHMLDQVEAELDVAATLLSSAFQDATDLNRWTRP